MVFFGEYSMNITAGGRLTLPRKIRDAVGGDTCVITKGFDTCLAGYGRQDWEERSQEFVSRSLIDRSELSVRRMLFSGAEYVELDEQGRFVVPKHLLVHAAIEKEVVIAGIGDHFEVWSAAAWSTYVNDNRS